MGNIVKCKSCGENVSKTAPSCPHCGETYPGLSIKCPKCDSMNFSVGQKGFGVVKQQQVLFF
jgi:ssDNA-binding Zn-finger/Zn-ribbon topoisomerase 1